MRVVSIPFLVLVLCHSAFADPPAASGKLNEQVFPVEWVGTGSPPQAGQDASVYLESVSDYDGNLCDPFIPPGFCVIKLYTHNLHNDPDEYGLTTCDSGSVSNGYCTGSKTGSIHPTLIAQHGRDEENIWCHEFGHVIGANHVPGYGITSGCLHDWEDLTYHLHHISDHLQWD